MIQQNVKKGINIYKYYVSYKVSHMESYKNQPVFYDFNFSNVYFLNMNENQIRLVLICRFP